jgi:hypothetical protein
VQWHPEFLPQLAEQRELFCRLVKEAKRWRGCARAATTPAAPYSNHKPTPAPPVSIPAAHPA